MATQVNRKFAVVTGGSQGIGFELASLFTQNGYDVLIIGDREVEQARTRLARDGSQIIGLECDLATPEGIQESVKRIDEVGRPVDALCLNSGIGVGGRFLETDLAKEVQMIALNCTSVVMLAKHLLPRMVERGEGKVLITSSIAATMPAPYETVYGATKAFDLQFSEGLRYELKDTGVTVTAMQPGPTDTNFFERGDMMDTKVGADEKDDPALVAKQGYEAMMKGTDKIYVGSMKTRAQGWSTEVLPETVKAKQHAKLSEPGSASKVKH